MPTPHPFQLSLVLKKITYSIPNLLCLSPNKTTQLPTAQARLFLKVSMV